MPFLTLLDLLFGLFVVSLVVNLTSSRLPMHYVPSVMRWGWFGSAIYVTIRVMSMDSIQQWLRGHFRPSVLSFLVAAILSAAVGVVYWAIITKIDPVKPADSQQTAQASVSPPLPSTTPTPVAQAETPTPSVSPTPTASPDDQGKELVQRIRNIDKRLNELRDQSPTSLKRRTLDLSKRILLFADQRRRNEPPWPTSPKDSEAYKAEWKKSEEYLMENLRLYIRDFSSDVIAITGELKSEGVTVEFLDLYGHGRSKIVANLSVIEDIAGHLAIGAGRLKEP